MRSKPAKFALALLATSSLCATGLEFGRESIARAQLDRLLAGHPGLSVARIDTGFFSGSVTLFDLRTKVGTAIVTIGALRLPASHMSLIDEAQASPFDDEPAKPEGGPATDETPAPKAAPTSPPPASSGTATAENVVITSGTTTYKIKRIDLTVTTLSSADLAVILDAKDPTSLGDRLKKLTAASIVVPELTADDVTPDHETHMTERDILLANVVAGRVANGSAAGVTTAMKDPKSVVNGTLGAIEVKGLDLTQVVRVFNTKRTDDSEPLVPLMDSVAVNSGSFENVTQNSTITFGAIKEAGFKGRPLRTDPADASSSDKEKSKAVVNDILHSFAVDNFQLSNLAFHDEGDKDQFKIAEISMKQFGNGRIGGLTANDFLFQSKDTKIGIGSTEIGAFDVPTGKDASSADAKTTNMPLVGKTDVKDITIDALVPASNPGSEATHMKFDMKHIGFTGEGKPGEPPTTGSMKIENLTFDVPANSAGQSLIDIGYPHLDISSGANSTYDAGGQTLAVKDFSVTGVDMGTVALSFDLSNVNPALFSSNTAESKVAALAVILKGVDLKLDNKGLVQKLYAWQAKSSGKTPDQIRDALVDMAANQMPSQLGGGANAKTIGTAVGKFLADPKTLHVALRSKSGLGMADAALFATPNVLLDALDVTATANE